VDHRLFADTHSDNGCVILTGAKQREESRVSLSEVRLMAGGPAVRNKSNRKGYYGRNTTNPRDDRR
jgi:hypothetical protein